MGEFQLFLLTLLVILIICIGSLSLYYYTHFVYKKHPYYMWRVYYKELGENRELFIRAKNRDQVMQLYAKKAKPWWFFIGVDKLPKENE